MRALRRAVFAVDSCSMACGPSARQAVRPAGVRHCGRRRTAQRCASISTARLRLEASHRSRSATRSRCRSTAPIAWDANSSRKGGCMRSPNGIRASQSTTTCAAGIRNKYLGQGEFYLEYGNIDFAITVPRGFIVAGTGRLTNPLEVLTATERERLARALRSDSTVAIIAKSEVGQAATRPAGTGATLTWRFSANNVRDVAWAAARNFIWDASGWNGILLQSFYPPAADSVWRESTRIVRHSIRHYSEKWFPYPYPTAINVNGPVAGMEYPMIVFCASRRSARGLFGVTTHELGHQWFPMIVGSNERLYAWMDEGFNTFMNTYSARAFYPAT